MSDNEWHCIADILKDHEYYFSNGGCCRGACEWRGTHYEWTWHIQELINEWMLKQITGIDNV